MLMRIERNMAVEEGVLVQVEAVVPELLIRPKHKFLLQQFWLQMVRLRVYTIRYAPSHEIFVTGIVICQLSLSVFFFLSKLVFSIVIIYL